MAMQNEKKCQSCGVVLRDFYVKASEILGTKERWIVNNSKLCNECEKTELAKKEDEKRRKVEQDKYNNVFGLSSLSKLYFHKTFRNFFVKNSNRTAYNKANEFAYKTKGKSLYVYGNVGTGKTHLAFAAAKVLMNKKTVLALSVPELLYRIKSTFSEKHNESYDLVNKAKSVSVLVLDDLGSEKATEWVREILFVIINYRYSHKLMTLVTSNHDLESISCQIDSRIASRLKEMCDVAYTGEVDYRATSGLYET